MPLVQCLAAYIVKVLLRVVFTFNQQMVCQMPAIHFYSKNMSSYPKQKNKTNKLIKQKHFYFILFTVKVLKKSSGATDAFSLMFCSPLKVLLE